MVVVPADNPVTIPDEEPIAATEGLVLTHVPPPEGSVNAAGSPVQTVAGPDIGNTRLITLIVVVAEHPDGTV